MNKFKEQLKIIEEALLKPMSAASAQAVDDEKEKIILERIKKRIDELKKHATLNENGTYDVNGDVDLFNMNLTELPMKFGKVSGNFYCLGNKLTSLEDAPTYVGGYFNCSDNKLTSLIGSPNKIIGHFSCSGNKLTSLEGAPTNVDGSFYCRGNTIKFTEKDVKNKCNVKGSIYV